MSITPETEREVVFVTDTVIILNLISSSPTSLSDPSNNFSSFNVPFQITFNTVVFGQSTKEPPPSFVHTIVL